METVKSLLAVGIILGGGFLAHAAHAAESDAHYKNCTEARAAGAAPIYKGEPDYRPALDRDNDGVACE